MIVIPYKNEKYFKQVLHSMESFVLFFLLAPVFVSNRFSVGKMSCRTTTAPRWTL